MKYLLILVALFLCITLIIPGCNKNTNNYSVTDHTTGMIKIRSWSGYAFGNSRGDTLWNTVHVAWPEYFCHTVTDTSFSVLKVNGFSINVEGTELAFRSVDSVNKIVKFDFTYANSATSFLIWDFGQDTMYYEFHKIYGHNDSANKYYETNQVLRSNH